jgi:hypothetical protein
MTLALAFLVVLYIVVICLLLVLNGTRSSLRLASKKQPATLSWGIFITVLLVELGAGYYFTCIKNTYMIDAISKVANAFYVLNIQPAHLASIGFVWMPLPSFLEIPLLLFVSIYKPMATAGFAGVIITSLFAAGTAVLIYKSCQHFKLSHWLTILIILLYAFNPFIFLYGFNGMSEAIFIFFIVWTVVELIYWVEDEKPRHLILIGIALALAFLTRYEAVPFAIAVFLSVGFFMIKKRSSQNSGESMWHYFEGTSIVLFLPLITCGLLWILANWIIIGDPLFFLTSEYSNVAFTQNLGLDMLALKGNISAVLVYVAERSYPFLILLAFILLFRLFGKRLFQWETMMIIVLCFSLLVFQCVLLVMGNSYGWLRFFVYPLPIAIAWLPYEFSKLKIRQNAFRIVAACFCCIALIATSISTWRAINNPEIGREEYNVYLSESSNIVLMIQKDVAEYINQNCANGVLLLDSFKTYYVILNLNSTDKVITTCSYIFDDAVKDPGAYDVKYVLAVDPSDQGTADAINVYYPELYDNGADWCILVAEFDGYRLYETGYD